MESKQFVGEGLWYNYIGKHEGHKKLILYAMTIFVILESSFLYFQAYKCFRTRSAQDLSLSAFIILLVVNAYWVFYGVFILKDFPVLISGSLYVIGSALIVASIILYS